MMPDASGGHRSAEVSVEHRPLFVEAYLLCAADIAYCPAAICADQLRLVGTAKGVFLIPRIDLLANVRPKKHFTGDFMALTEQDVWAIPQDLTCRAIKPACTNLMQWPIVGRERLFDN